MILKRNWPDFKALIDASKVQWQYEERTNSYLLFGAQGPFYYECIVAKDGGSDQTEFEASYEGNETAFISVDTNISRGDTNEIIGQIKVTDGSQFVGISDVGGQKAIKVDVIQGSTSGLEVLDGDTANLGTDTGKIIAGYDGIDYQFISVNSSGRLQVDVISGGTSGQQVADGSSPTGGNPSNDFGNILVGYDGTNYQFLSVDSLGNIQVDILTLPALPAGSNNIGDVDVLTLPNVTLASQANPFTSALPVSDNGGSLTVDNSGTFEVQAAQSGTWNINNISGTVTLPTGAATEATIASILSGQLPDGHNVTVDNASGASAVNIQDGGNSITIDNTTIDTNLDVLLSTRATEATLVNVKTALEIMDDWDESDRAKVNPVVGQAGLAGGSGVDAANALRVSLATNVALPAGTNRLGSMSLVDPNDQALPRNNHSTVPSNMHGIPIMGTDLDGYVHIPSCTEDNSDGKFRLSIEGKVSVSAPSAPPSASPITIDASSPLDVTSISTTNYTIPNGVTFTVTQVIYGSEGDPNEKGNKAEIYYVDASSNTHLIDRVYFTGFSGQIFPDTKTARDGTTMVGNGTTTQIRIIRERLGGAALEIDVVVRGYYE